MGTGETGRVVICGERHAEAIEAIKAALSAAVQPYVAISGGKDSMAMAHLVVSVDPSVPLVHSLHGARRLPPQWPRVLVEACESMGARDVRVVRYNQIWASKRLAEQGWDLVMVGVRKDESARRRRLMEAGRQHGRVPQLWPLADWSVDDVWHCIDSHGVPYPNLYDVLGRSRWRLHWPDPAESSLRANAQWGRIRYKRTGEADDLRMDYDAVDEEPPTYRRTRSGEWVVCGSPAVVQAGHSVSVRLDDGSWATEKVVRVGATFSRGDRECVYGYLA